MGDGASTSPKQVQLLVNAVPILGRGGGQYINLVHNREQFTENVGVDGIGFFVVVPDLSGRLTVSVLQNSDSNDYLNSLFAAQMAAPGGLAWRVLMQERNGRTRFAAARAVITKYPDIGFSDTGEVRVWTFASTRWLGSLGGLPPTPIGSVEVPSFAVPD